MQQILSGEGHLGQYNDSAFAPFRSRPAVCWTSIWDTRNAKFEACFLPVINFVPSVIAVLVLAWQIICLATSRQPQWLQPFVQEYHQPTVEDIGQPKRKWTIFTLSVTALSAVGFALNVTSAILVWPSLTAPLPAMTWLVAAGSVSVYMPRTVPYTVLIILTAQAVSDVIAVANGGDVSSDVNLDITIASLVIALLAIIVILCMPLRDPNMPAKEISQTFSEPTSSLRSPEDNLSLWQFMTVAWMAPLIRLGSKRQLEDEDVWQLAYEFQHRILHANFRELKGTVIQRLLRANGIDLVILTCLGLLELAANYAVPLLLQRLLASMEDFAAPKRAAATYAGLSLVVRLVACQSSVFSLWFGRRCYERSRGEMITMLYEKTLGRKMAFPPEIKDKTDVANGKTRAAANGSNGQAAKPKPGNESKGFMWNRVSRSMRNLLARKQDSEPVKEPASMGKILNLMRNDVYEVAQRFWEFQTLITKPLSCVLSIVLVVRFLGASSLLAVVLLLTCQVINVGIARILIFYEKKRRVATDVKLEFISQFVEAIRHLRWYGWQGHWLDQILSARQRELSLRVKSNVCNVVVAFFNTLGLDLTPVVAFFAYTVIAGKPLRVDIAFPAIQLFQMLTMALRDLPNLIIVITNAWVAVGRIEDFMAEPERQEMTTEALIGDSLAIEHASFSWPGTESQVLRDINISFPEGITLICGEVASGKTALLQALLGELDMSDGQLIRPREPVGYCAQTPWLQSMSIRENIIFSSPYDDKRYKDVLEACALTPDLAEMKAGDLSLIGENGIGLSGGQRARVALARAVYSRTRILLLDDPLSALDQQTAEAIVQKCFAGPLLKDRTVVLVTHRTDLRNAAAVPDKFIEDEHRAQGNVQARVYWEYIKAGKLRWWSVIVLILLLYRLISTLQNWFVKAWAEAYNERSSVLLVLLHKDTGVVKPSGLFGNLPPPEADNRPWLLWYLALSLGTSITYVISQAFFIVLVYVAGRTMFKDVMVRVAHATFRFYDVTPIGRLMNRMTSDIGVVDGGISYQLQSVVWLSLSWVTSVVIIASVTPAFLVFSAALTAAFILIFNRFLPTSQSLRRLETVSLTPLMSNFGALLNGLATVRAFCAQSRFQEKVFDVVDTFQKMDHFYWSLQAWLMYRFDALSALSTFLITILALATGVSPGLTAFLLAYANRFVTTTHMLCKQYGQLQMEFVSVERIVELLRLDQEPGGDIHPPAWWPSFSGDIVFDKVTIRYAPNLDPALSDVSFTVRGGSKTAIIGRTGSGKSTLALAMLATIVPESGQILVDNLNLAEVDKQLLRTRITFLAQDPVLFPGSMRQNLDPVGEHTDEACELVLRRVCERQGWKLDTKIEAGGRNLSQGQRQLVGLARAVLRRSAIIILDEATASIDRETAMQIQQVMHEEMKDSTVITIAHRLEAVKNADYCIVLGKGKVLKEGPAAEMLNGSTAPYDEAFAAGDG
ncbi:hypothetical protein BAUCODRAFT_63331 [Baudoinia panamericana UAMH 10762]|uniref:ABC transporter n=1 Tax=Baudoinia panamericana (strain UAMH 10762) TaxID=717646 RepID=M2NL33_BAUPA|nr:uncharacterized protein BAUCODRAFT_63331 [Baudoinia panamericana UAMH 10762]EMC99860.1 hypothetical protein BAUCODRAFT_63331 [Baudoinia panamericana UAMH 10762]